MRFFGNWKRRRPLSNEAEVFFVQVPDKNERRIAGYISRFATGH